MHNLLVRAIITGFGLRIGAELGKYIANKILPKDKDNGGESDEEDESLGTITPDPPDV
ncbi:MAG TPA: hypothetical protein VK034_04370 [Enhygromyxa sp.]|nr:hypothetical protein [Enhygromyxa sp.]